MPDNKYNVDDILREIRRGQPSEPAASVSPSQGGDLWEEAEEEYRPPAKRETAASRRTPTASSRPLWEDEEEPPRPSRASQPKAEVKQPSHREIPAQPVWESDEEEPPRPVRPSQTKAGAKQPPRRETQAQPLWEDDEEEPPRLSRPSQAKAASKQPPRRETQAQPLWEDDEEEPLRPARPSQTKAGAKQPPRRETQARSLWEDNEEELSRPSRPSQTKAAAKQPPHREVPAQPLWEDDEEPFRPSRPAEPKAKTPRQAARSQALWEAEDAQPPRESSPAIPRSAVNSRQEIPSLSRWEERYEPAPAKTEPKQRKEPPARPLWEDEAMVQTPENSARTSGRNLNAAAAAQLITGGEGEEPKKSRRRRDEEKEEERPRSRRRREENEEEEKRPRSRRRREENDEEEERPRSRRRREESDDEEERPRSRRRREEGSEEEEERPRTRVNVAAQLRGMKNGLILRLIVNLLCAAGVIYLMLAPRLEFPIPEYFMDNPGQYLWLGVGLVVFSALVSGNTIGGGVISLFCLRPNNDSYSAIGVFACLVQGAYIAMRPEMMASYAANLYLPMAALLLLFNTIGKLILRGRVAGSYRLIAKEGAKHTAAVIDDHELAGKIGGDMIDDDPEIAYFTRSAGVLSFLDQAFSESKAEDISRVIAPMTAVAALVMALISYPFHKDVFTSACVFTAALCITAPIAGVIVTELPIALTNRRLGRWGATFCGYSAVDQFSGVNELLLRGYNLFPPESVTLHDVRTFNRASEDQVTVDIASVLSQCDSTLTQFIMEMVPDRTVLRQTESFVCEDGKGVSAWVEGRRVLVGNRELMRSYGVVIPPPEYEEQYGQDKQILYVSNSGQAAAMYVLSYKGDRQMRRALELLADLDIAVYVYTTDPYITADRISQVYNFPRELVKVIPAALHPEVDRCVEPKNKVKAGMIHNGQPSSYVRGVAAARSCDNALTLETALLLLSVVVGFALVTFFAFTGGMPALTWITIAIYQAFWGVVQLLVAFFKSV